MRSKWQMETHLATADQLIAMFARIIDTLPFQLAVGRVCWIYHSHDDAPKTEAGPLPLSIQTQTTALLTIRQPRISRPSLPLLCRPDYIWRTTEDDTQVLEFAVLITQRDAMFLVIHNRGQLVVADPCSSILQGNASGLCFKQRTWNFPSRQINIVGKRRADVMTLF